MLDAFGKGASEDIQAAKSELYKQMTWDPAKQSFALHDSTAMTPMASPPPSPRQPLSARAASEHGAFPLSSTCVWGGCMHLAGSRVCAPCAHHAAGLLT